jgi:hypothetical protein
MPAEFGRIGIIGGAMFQLSFFIFLFSLVKIFHAGGESKAYHRTI